MIAQGKSGKSGNEILTVFSHEGKTIGVLTAEISYDQILAAFENVSKVEAWEKAKSE